MWAGCIKCVSWHVCQGPTPINPHYVNPSVNPPQPWQPKPASISADRPSAWMPWWRGQAFGCRPHCTPASSTLHVKQEQLPGRGRGRAQSIMSLDHGSCLCIQSWLNLFCTCGRSWLALVKQLEDPSVVLENRACLYISWGQCGVACPSTKKPMSITSAHLHILILILNKNNILTVVWVLA